MSDAGYDASNITGVQVSFVLQIVQGTGIGIHNPVLLNKLKNSQRNA